MILLALALLLQEPVDDLGRGPLHMTSLSPFQTLRSGLTPRPPSVLPEGTWEARVTESWANLWAYNEDDILIDMEILHSNLALGLGFGNGWRADLELELSSRFGGSMDGLINSVHNLLGAETRHREDFPNDDFQFDLEGHGERPSASLSNSDRGLFSNSLVGTVQWTFSEGGPGRPALSAALSLRADLGPNRDLRGGSPMDLGLSFSAAERAGPFLLSASLLVAWYGTETFQDIPLRQIQTSGLAAVEWPFHASASLLLQYLLSEGIAEDWMDFSRPSHEILFGLKAELGSGALCEVGLLENLAIPDNSPDFGIHAGCSIRF